MKKILLFTLTLIFSVSIFAQINPQEVNGVKEVKLTKEVKQMLDSRAVDTVLTYFERGSGIYIYSAGQGYVVGNNCADLSGYGLSANEPYVQLVGMHYDGVANASITEVLAWFGAKEKIGSADSFDMKVYEIGADTIPTADLASVTITTDDVDTASLALTSIPLTSPVDLMGNHFMVGFDFLSMTDDTVGIFSNNADSSDGNMEYRTRCNFGQNLQTTYSFTWTGMNGGAFLDYDADGYIFPVLDIASGKESMSQNGLTIKRAHPNPTNSTTTIRYSLDKKENVNIKVFDLTGKDIYSKKETKTAGDHYLKLDMSKLPTGNYYYTITTNSSRITSKLVKIK